MIEFIAFLDFDFCLIFLLMDLKGFILDVFIPGILSGGCFYFGWKLGINTWNYLMDLADISDEIRQREEEERKRREQEARQAKLMQDSYNQSDLFS